MYVAIVPNRSSRPAILLRESYRDGDSVKNRTLANLSHWPAEQIETLRAALRGDKLVPVGEGMEIVRALQPGHGAPASVRRNPGALRRKFELRRRALLRAGTLWSFAGPPL